MTTRFRLFVALIVLAFPLALAAQPANELGLWVSSAQFEGSRFVDEDLAELELDFESNIGYGVSFSHYFTPALATEFSAHKLSADANIRVSGPGVPEFSFDGGELEVMAYAATVQWHFARGSRISPYVGAGAAYLTGEVTGEDFETGENVTTDLDNEVTWLANAGVNFGLTQSTALALDAKYIAYDPKAEGDPDSEREELNPIVISAGLRFRF